MPCGRYLEATGEKVVKRIGESVKCFFTDRYKAIMFVALIICCFSEPIKQLSKIPIVHLGNAIIFVMFAVLFIKGECKKLNEREIRIFIIVWVAFLLYGTFSALLFGLMPVLYLWSLRSYIRFFILMLDCYLVFDKKDVPFFYMVLDLVALIHSILIVIQFFVFDINWDYLNGIFGTMMGGNSGANALLAINTCVCFYRFYKKEIKFPILYLHIFWMTYSAALSELKVYLVELVAILVIYPVVTREFKRWLKILPGIIIIMFTSTLVMYMLYPWFESFYSQLFTDFAKRIDDPHHMDDLSLSRLKQISGLTQPIMDYAQSIKPSLKGICLWTGIGLGNGELTLNGMFNSEFYDRNNILWYWDFILSMIYIETGIIGLLTYNSVWFIVPITAFIRSLKTRDEGNLMKIMMSAMVLFIIFYDIAMRNNYGYILWAFIGIVYAALNKKEVLT